MNQKISTALVNNGSFCYEILQALFAARLDKIDEKSIFCIILCDCRVTTGLLPVIKFYNEIYIYISFI